MGDRIVYLNDAKVRMNDDDETWRDLLSPADQGAVDLGRSDLLDEQERVLALGTTVPLGESRVILRTRKPSQDWLSKFCSDSHIQSLPFRSVFFLLHQHSPDVDTCRAAVDEFRRVGVTSAGFHSLKTLEQALVRSAQSASGGSYCCVAEDELLGELNSLRTHWDQKPSRHPKLILGCALSVVQSRKHSRKSKLFDEYLPGTIPLALPTEEVCLRVCRSLWLDASKPGLLHEQGSRAEEERKRIREASHQMLGQLPLTIRVNLSREGLPISEFLHGLCELGGVSVSLDRLEKLSNRISPLREVFTTLRSSLMDVGRRGALKKMFDLLEFLGAPQYV